MGLYDRDYTQAGSPPNIGESFANSSMTVKIVIVTVVIFALDNLFLNNRLSEFSAINDNLFTGNFRIWELLTYGFAHAPLSETVWHIVGNMWGLFFFGREVERKYGSREFLALYLGMIVLSGAIWCGMKLITQGSTAPGIVGASGAISALIVLFALNFPNRKIMLMFFPIALPAWVLGMFIVGSDIFGAMGMRGDKIAFVAHLGGAALGALYYFAGFRLTGGTQYSDGGYGSSDGGYGSRSAGWKMPSFKMPSLKSKPKLKVHSPRDEALDQKADKILEKMSREGAESITGAERKVLDEYSRRVRKRRS